MIYAPCSTLLRIGVLLALALAVPGMASAAGDTEKGARVFKKCKACHTLKEDQGHTIGPNLHGVFTRAPASLPGFKYSQALKKRAADGLKWDDETLDAFLKKPSTYIKGTNMAFAGLRRESDRVNVIAYLKQATGEAKP